MKARIISGIIGLFLLISIVIKGGFLLNFSVLVVGLIGLYEFNKTVRKIDIKPLTILNYLTTILLFILINIKVESYIPFFITVYFFFNNVIFYI